MIKTMTLGFAVLAATLFVSGAASAEATIDWRLENNFPMFPDRAALETYVRKAASGVRGDVGVAIPASRELDPGLWKRVRREQADHRKTLHDRRHPMEITWSGGPSGACTLEFITAEGNSETSARECSSGKWVRTATIDMPFSVQLIAEGTVLASLSDIPRDITIVGIGDSYASGEGNPDAPARLSDHYTCAQEGGRCTQNSSFRWTQSYDALAPAGWLDRQCHRSLYSHQVQAAANLAAAHPKRLVRFAFWSCSGAEVMDGLLRPQQSPPGGASNVRDSQLDAATTALCVGQVKASHLQAGNLADENSNSSKIRMLDCTDMRRPDIVVLSIGGNDVKFSAVVLNLLAPSAGNILYRQALAMSPKRMKPQEAGKLISNGWLRDQYRLLDSALRRNLVGPTKAGAQTRVIQVNYPNPVRFAGTQARWCVTRWNLGTDTLAELYKATQNGGFGITESESRQVSEHLISPLQSAVASNAQLGWTIAQSHLHEWEQHGFCSPEADDARRAEYAFPKYLTRNNGMWAPDLPRPSQWNGYARTTRWIRMPNDSFLTQHIRDTGNPVPFSEALYGTAHPNAYGQAALARSLLLEMTR